MKCQVCEQGFETGEAVLADKETGGYLHWRCALDAGGGRSLRPTRLIVPAGDIREEIAALHRRLEDREKEHELLVNDSTATILRQEKRILEMQLELEQLRRSNAQLRELVERAEQAAADDFEAATNWRRYVAIHGEQRASLYLVPPKKGDGH